MQITHLLNLYFCDLLLSIDRFSLVFFIRLAIVILAFDLHATYHSLSQFRLVEDRAALLLQMLQCLELAAELGTPHVRMLHLVVHISQIALDFVHPTLYTLVLFYQFYELGTVVLLTLVRIL